MRATLRLHTALTALLLVLWGSPSQAEPQGQNLCDAPRMVALRSVDDTVVREDGVRAVLGDSGMILIFDAEGAPWAATHVEYALNLAWREDGALLLLNPDEVRVATVDLPPPGAPTTSTPPPWRHLPAVDPPLAAGGDDTHVWVLTRRGWWIVQESASEVDPQWLPHAHTVLEGDAFGRTIQIRPEDDGVTLSLVVGPTGTHVPLASFPVPLHAIEVYPIGSWIVVAGGSLRVVWEQGALDHLWLAHHERHAACAGLGWSWRRLRPTADRTLRSGIACDGEPTSQSAEPLQAGLLGAITSSGTVTDERARIAPMPSHLVSGTSIPAACRPVLHTMQGGLWIATPDGTWASPSIDPQMVHPGERSRTLPFATLAHWLRTTPWERASPPAPIYGVAGDAPASATQQDSTASPD